MPLAYNAKRCIFFVGGDAAKSSNGSAGQNNNGGCTKEWWDSTVAIDGVSYAMELLMFPDGSPIDEVVDATSSDEGGGYVKITKTDGFHNAEPGHIAWVHDNNSNMDDGLLEVITADPSGQYIIVETSFTAASVNVDVNIGGAWETIPAVAEEITAASFTQEIWCNKDFVLSASMLALNWGDGNKLKDTWLKVMGFNRTPYDMHKGGEFYQNAANALINGVGSTAAVHIDFDDTDVDGIVIDGNENMRFENIFSLDMYVEGIRASFLLENMPENIIFNHCFARGGMYAFKGEGNGVYFFDCYLDIFARTTGYASFFSAGSILRYEGCAVKLGTGGTGFSILGGPHFLTNCIVFGGSVAGGMLFGGKAYYGNNVFYNQTDAVFITTTSVTSGLIVARNNIAILATQADFVYKVYAGGGSVFEDRNCIYSLLGALTAIGENDYPDAQDAEKGPSTIEEDPQFADASGGDFTPENKNLRDADGQFIGAVQTLPDMPAVGNVTDDDSVDDAAGTFVVPAVGDVEAGVQYGGGGDEFTGTLAAPSAPTVTLAEGDGQITATIAGDAGASHYVLYKKPADTGWCAGGNRTGDGDVTIADLDNNVPYMFVVYSFVDSIPSLPAVAQTVTLADSTEATAIDGAFAAANVQMIAQFGKTVIYRPAGGGSRPIKAVVKQKAPGSIGAAPGATSTVTTVMVLNDSTNGISSSEIDIGGGDKIDIAYRIGLEATARRIGKIVFQNPAVMKLEVR